MKKDSFILHNDSLEILDELTDEEAGKLFKAIYQHHLNLNNEDYTEDILKDRALQFAFKPFKNQLNRDFEKYKQTVEKRKKAGAKGGKQRVANQASASSAKQNQANQAVNDSVSVSDNVNDSVSVSVASPQKNKPSNVISKYKELISNSNQDVREQTSYNQIALKGNDIDKMIIGIENFANSNQDFKYSLPNFIKDGIYLDYQKAKAIEKKGSILIPKDLIGKVFKYDGETIEFKENGYYKQEKQWLVKNVDNVKEMIQIYHKGIQQKEITSSKVSNLLQGAK